MVKKKGLGRGLSALIDDFDNVLDSPGAPLEVPLDQIAPNPFQPRQTHNDNLLKSLAESIKSRGVLEPLLVRRAGPEQFELIAGERRLRASQMARLKTVPVIIREASQSDMLEMALIENLHREDLNPIEEAQAYRRLGEEFKRTQAEIARLTGHDRSTVANLLRLLNLPEAIQKDVIQGRLSAGHARALLALEKKALMLEAREEILKHGLSVRQTEALVKKLGQAPARKDSRSDGDRDYFEALAKRIGGQVGAKVRLIRKGKQGRIEIRFSSDQELERLLDYFGIKSG